MANLTLSSLHQAADNTFDTCATLVAANPQELVTANIARFFYCISASDIN